MSDPAPSPSVPESADAQDLASPEGAAMPAAEAGDAFAQGVGGAPAADELGGDEGPADAAPEVVPPASTDAGPEVVPPASAEAGPEVVPSASAPDDVDPQDLAPALDAAGIEHDMGTTGATGAPTGSEDTSTGEAARTGKSVDLALGIIRLGVGVALVAAPRWAGRIWVGPGADGPGSLVFARTLGARDVALGVRILDGVRKGEPVGHWVSAGFAADAADVAATVIAGRHLTPGRRAAMPLIAGAVGALGAWSGRRSQG